MHVTFIWIQYNGSTSFFRGGGLSLDVIISHYYHRSVFHRVHIFFYVLGISAPTPGGLSRRIIWGLPKRRGIRMSSPTLKVANRNRNWNRMTLLRTNLVHQVQAGSLGAL